MRRANGYGVVALLVAGLAASAVNAQTGVDHQVLSNGGSSSTAGGLTPHGTVGQVTIGLTDNGSNKHRLGYWEVPKVLHTPVLVLKNGATQADATPTLDWNDVLGATEYELEYDDDSGFGSSTVVNVTDNTYTFPADLAEDVFYWRVRAIGPLSSSILSVSDNFAIGSAAPPPPADLSIPLNALDFGNIEIGQSLTLPLNVANSGGQTGSATPALSGANSSLFSLSTSSLNVSAGGSTTLNVTLTPTATGSIAGTLTLDFGVESFTINLTGSGEPPPPAPAQLSLLAATLDFGDVEVGQSSTLSLQVQNTGGTSASATPALDDGDLGFALANGQFTAGPGASVNHGITFAPTEEGEVSVTVTLNFGVSTFQVVVTGQGIVIPPVVEVEQTSVDFGINGLDIPKTLNVSIANTGEGDLVVSAVEIDTARWTVTVTPLTIAPAESGLVEITYLSDVEGNFEDIIRIATNDPNNLVVEIALSAQTFVGGQIGVPTSFGVGAAAVGATASNGLLIQNTGEAVLSVTLAFAEGSPFSSSLPSLDIEPGQSGTIPVDLMPGAEGDIASILTLTTNDALNPMVDVELLGYGGVPPEGSVTIDFAVAANDQEQRIVGNAAPGEPSRCS